MKKLFQKLIEQQNEIEFLNSEIESLGLPDYLRLGNKKPIQEQAKLEPFSLIAEKNGKKVYKDNKTGLIWSDVLENKMNHYGAEKFVENKDFSDDAFCDLKLDWRPRGNILRYHCTNGV